MLEVDLPQRKRDFMRQVRDEGPVLVDLGGAFLFPQEFSPFQEKAFLNNAFPPAMCVAELGKLIALTTLTAPQKMRSVPQATQPQATQPSRSSLHNRLLDRSINKRHSREIIQKPKSHKLRGGR